MANTLLQILKDYSVKYAESPVQYVKNGKGIFEPVSYKEFYNKTLTLAVALSSLNVKQGSYVGVISENRGEWLLIDQALGALRAANVPRGVDVTKGELEYILDFADCETVFVENITQLNKTLEIKDSIPKIKNIILLDGEKKEVEGLNILTFDEFYKSAEGKDNAFVEALIDSGEKDDVATIIFTSGTTGDPKGVMLSQYNFVHQTNFISERITSGPGDIWLSVLPVWHSYERALQYISMVSGSAIAYSKPIGSVMLKDIEALNPTWLGSVPRIWDALKTGIYKKVNSGSPVSKALFHFFTDICIKHRHLTDAMIGITPRFTKRSRLVERLVSVGPWLLLAPLSALGKVLVLNKIKSKFGTRFVAGISGGGSLPEHVEEFFNAAGILLLEGYGLTESAPIIALKDQMHPVRNCIGLPYGCELKVCDEEGNTLPPGEKGVLFAKGGQVMLGYLKKDDLTKTVLDEDGWLNTGDLAVKSFDGEFKIVGREKDTVVLLGGENLEPGPIERKLSESEYIQSSVIVGQDKKYISALIVLELDNVKLFAKNNNISYDDDESLCDIPEVREILNDAISTLVSQANGFKAFERIYKFKLMVKPFEIGKELSGKQDLKRHAIAEIYKKEIEALYK